MHRYDSIQLHDRFNPFIECRARCPGEGVSDGAAAGATMARVTPSADAGVSIEMAREYVLGTLRSIPIREEGVHSFRLLIAGQPPLSVDIPVIAVPSSVSAAVMH